MDTGEIVTRQEMEEAVSRARLEARPSSAMIEAAGMATAIGRLTAALKSTEEALEKCAAENARLTTLVQELGRAVDDRRATPADPMM